MPYLQRMYNAQPVDGQVSPESVHLTRSLKGLALNPSDQTTLSKWRISR
jgi:hypothetical protein